MRLKSKFKILKQLKHWKNAEYYPSKLFKTNKKSWKTILSSYSDKKGLSVNSVPKLNLNSIVNVKRWDFNKKLYKQGLELKRYYYHIFDYIIKSKLLKKIYLNESKKFNENNFINASLYLLRPNYRLDVLLWSLGFTNSIYEARNTIFGSNVLLNSNTNPNPNNVLKTGDIVSVKSYSKKLTFKDVSQKRVYFQKQFNFFCEIDYYSRTLIVTHDFSNIIQSYDNPQVFFKKLDIRKFVSYLKREY